MLNDYKKKNSCKPILEEVGFFFFEIPPDNSAKIE